MWFVMSFGMFANSMTGFVYEEYVQFFWRNNLEARQQLITYSRVPGGLVQIFFLPFLGILSDRVGRRPMWIMVSL